MAKYRTKIFPPINNFIYLYHTNTLLMLPAYPDNITDNSTANFNPDTPLARTAPIYSYQSSGPRSLTVTIQMHREMMNLVNYENTWAYPEFGDDYVDMLCKCLQAAVLPNYDASKKMVDPPVVAVKLGDEIYCKGVINGTIGISYGLPIISFNGKDKFAQVGVSFSISEITPYDAETIMGIGSYRVVGDIQLPTSLERGVVTSNTAFKKSLGALGAVRNMSAGTGSMR